MRILGVHDGHNATACLLEDGQIKACVQEERLTRIKNHDTFPRQAIREVCRLAGVTIADIDYMALNGNNQPPSRSKEEWLAYFTEAKSLKLRLRHLARSTPALVYYRGRRREERKAEARQLGLRDEQIVFIEHHRAHAEAAYWGSPWRGEPVLVLTNDGSGDDLCATINIVRQEKMERIYQVNDHKSIGLLYAIITAMLGMVPLEHEYKLMGMAPYAPEKGADISYRALQQVLYFEDREALEWQISPAAPAMGENDVDFYQRLLKFQRFDWICAGLQRLTENLLVEWIRRAVRHTGIHKIALSGGTFMNVKANKLIGEMPEVESLFVFPSCGDESNAIGAAYALYRDKCEAQGQPVNISPLGHLYFGTAYADNLVEEALRSSDFRNLHYDCVDDIESKVAQLLTDGLVVGRCKGPMEWGARALGNRSILADPTRRDVVKVINDMIKSRDFWMPFAPSILAESADAYIVNPKRIPAPYMILSFDATEKVEDLMAGVHPYDLSVRPQVVYAEHNPDYHRLIRAFAQATGRGAILNTSFNLHGFPIVCSPADALDVLMRSGLEYLALGNLLVSKKTTR